MHQLYVNQERKTLVICCGGEHLEQIRKVIRSLGYQQTGSIGSNTLDVSEQAYKAIMAQQDKNNTLDDRELQEQVEHYIADLTPAIDINQLCTNTPQPVLPSSRSSSSPSSSSSSSLDNLPLLTTPSAPSDGPDRSSSSSSSSSFLAFEQGKGAKASSVVQTTTSTTSSSSSDRPLETLYSSSSSTSVVAPSLRLAQLVASTEADIGRYFPK